MDKSSNIKRKSGRTMVIINRWFLKLTLACLVLSCVIVCLNGLVFDDPTLIFSMSSTLIFSISYIVCYYLYKYFNKNKTENVKKDPLKAQIMLIGRLITFFVGACVALLGSYFVFQSHLWGYAIIAVGLILSEFLFANKRLTSHLSTFCENFAAGILFSYLFIAMKFGLNLWILLAFALVLLFIFLQELFYYFVDIKKHDLEGTSTKELLAIRGKYFLRNALLYFLLFGLVAILVYSEIFARLLESDIVNALLQLIPIVISIVSIVVGCFYTPSKEDSKKKKDYNQVLNYKDYYAKYHDTIGNNFDKSLDYVINNMGKKQGFTRYSGEDYFYHCLNVANILQNKNLNNENLLCTALLHDCIEDMKNVNKKEIEKLTNAEIAHSVQLLTKAPSIDYHQAENLKKYLDDILKDENATLVKIADRMHNISTLTNVSEEKRNNKIKETKVFYLPMIQSASTLYHQYRPFFDEAFEYFSSL
ncbi:MAG: HD domain-containing protein [Clostridia bacterium]|nr:HD domain-containing protein [Clostridia bacterium]